MIVFMIGFATTAMYSLPYMKSVFYDPMREALSLNHKQLGNLLSIYGIVATVSYFPGGWLADNVISPFNEYLNVALSCGFLGKMK